MILGHRQVNPPTQVTQTKCKSRALIMLPYLRINWFYNTLIRFNLVWFNNHSKCMCSNNYASYHSVYTCISLEVAVFHSDILFWRGILFSMGASLLITDPTFEVVKIGCWKDAAESDEYIYRSQIQLHLRDCEMILQHTVSGNSSNSFFFAYFVINKSTFLYTECLK